MITKCSNGHWYDTSVNKACPHCKQKSEKLSIRLNDVDEDEHTISIAEADISLGEQLGAIIGTSVNSRFPGGDLMERKNSIQDFDDEKTISFGFFGIAAVSPVVGWLICMSGTERGKDYRLHAGKNFIGRSTSMDVILIDDKSISREKHCSVIYDPKGNSFYVSAESGNISYLNAHLVEDSAMLKEGDVITIGKTDLLFIPFCREGRTWESE